MKLNTAKMGIAGVALTLMIGAIPAIAEGQWSSYLSSVGVGFKSRDWQDTKSDWAETKITLTGCTMNSGGSFASTDIHLKREGGWFPDQSIGVIRNYCGTSNFGNGHPAGTYNFTLDRINASTSSTLRISATTIVTRY